MIITFCGHSDFQETEEYRQAMLRLLDSIVGKEQVEFFLGNYGRFDKFAFSCCQQFKRKHSESTLIFVTPYRDQGYLERHMPVDGKYDEVLYPNIENRPLKFAISYRNKYMVEHADIVIAYVSRELGGAYKTYLYAKKKGKVIYNIFSDENKT